MNDRWGQSEALLSLSSARLRLAGYLAAKPLWEESLAIKREEGDRRGLADSLAVLGIRAASHNQTADALQYGRECHDTYVQISDRASQAEAHWNLGVLMTWAGQYEQAKESLIKAEALYGELGLRPPALILGNALAMLGEYEAVADYVDRYMITVGFTDKKPNEARAYNWLYYVAMARQDYVEARGLSQKSIAAYEACGLTAYAGLGLCFLGVTIRRLGDQGASWDCLEQGLRILQDRNQLGPLGIWLCAPMTAVLLADAGLLEEAVAAYTFATNHPMIANSVWFSEVMGDAIREVEANLSVGQVAWAQKQGRDAEPWQMGAEFLALVSGVQGQRNR
jgi:tetratricopeptide (TPR) repeat protein